VIIGTGLDPYFVFLHSPKLGRFSLVYDLLEFLRATVTEAVFAYGSQTSFEVAAFETANRGVVRLSAHVAREVATFAS
jgi:CRISPR/Cas system-associated endonuclease Cas1